MSDDITAVTEQMVTAAVREAREYFDIGGYVDSTRFVRSPTDPPPGPERDAALAALRAADAAAEHEVREAMRSVLRAAIEAAS